jgi:tagatose-1,6-bisphosphate aldolase
LFWSVADAAASGAAALKLLLPYHPGHPLAGEQRAVAAEVLGEARRVGVPVVLEPLFHSVTDADERAAVVLQTVDDFAGTGADLLKLPFPVDPGRVVDTAERVAACRAITQRCRQPWALLSGGGDFESFADQVACAVEAGCAGFMVGRALWGEAARAEPDRRDELISEVVRPRWDRLRALV